MNYFQDGLKELQKMAQYYNLTTDQIINLDNGISKEVVVESKEIQEQLKLIEQLDKDERSMIFKMMILSLPKRNLTHLEKTTV